MQNALKLIIVAGLGLLGAIVGSHISGSVVSGLTIFGLIVGCVMGACMALRWG